MKTAKRAFENLGIKEQKEYMQGAEAAVRIIDRLEPKLSSTKSAMSVSFANRFCWYCRRCERCFVFAG